MQDFLPKKSTGFFDMRCGKLPFSDEKKPLQTHFTTERKKFSTRVPAQKQINVRKSEKISDKSAFI